ncbi:MAG: Calx-beta domain-containing protein, partial [Planctomycetaceae bacterium]
MQSHDALIEQLEPRVLLAAQISADYELDGLGANLDAVPVINDAGTILLANPRGSFSAPFSWLTNQGVVLPGLTNGYRPSGKAMAPDINNAGVAVLVQYLDSGFTEQELVVYDVVNQKRLLTLNTLGAFTSFRDPQINDDGTIAVIAEEFDGTGGIYFLKNNILVPGLVRPGLVGELSNLQLLDDGRAVFRVDTFRTGDVYFTVDKSGNFSPFAGDVLASVRLSASSGLFVRDQSAVINHAEPDEHGDPRITDYMRVHVSLRRTAPENAPLHVRIRTSDLTATAGVDYAAMDEIVTIAPGEIATFIDIPLVDDEIWEDAEAFKIEAELIDDPWQYGFYGYGGTMAVGVILDQKNYQYGTAYEGQVVVEPGHIPTKLNVKARASYFPQSNDGDPPLTVKYTVIPLTATNTEVTASSGIIDVTDVHNISLPVSVMGNNSSASLKDINRSFLVLLQTTDPELSLDTQGGVYAIVDTDYVLNPDVSLTINGRGEISTILQGGDDKLVVIADGRIVREFGEDGGLVSLSDPVVFSNERDLAFIGFDNQHFGLYNGPSATANLLLADGVQLTSLHKAVYSGFSANDFSMSDNGNLVFITNYRKNDATATAGYGVYVVEANHEALRPNLMGSGFVVQNPPGNSDFNPSRQWGDEITISYSVTNQGNIDIGPTRVRFVASPDLQIDLDDLRLVEVSGDVAIPARGIGQSFSGQVTLKLPKETPAGFNPVGPIYLGMISDADNVIDEADETDNFDLALGFDKALLEISRKYVNVLIHGLNPNPFSYEDMNAAWLGFSKSLTDFIQLRGESDLKNNVENVTVLWESSKGWDWAAAYLLTDLILETSNWVGGPELDLVAPLIQTLLRYQKEQWMDQAELIARATAKKVVDELLLPSQLEGISILGSPVDDQWIHIIGHSRGAAVGAEVIRLLGERGYQVDRFTALDGYSTDWPGYGKELADISIVDAVADNPADYQLNFRVEQPLVEPGGGLMEQWLAAFAHKILSEERDLNFSQEVVDLFREWRAPVREGFINDQIHGREGEPSNHINISELFFSFDAENPWAPLPEYNPYTAMIDASMSEPSIDNRPINAMVSDEGELFADRFTNVFVDGGFEDAGLAQKMFAALGPIPSFGNQTIDTLLQLVGLSIFTSSERFDVVGSSELVNVGDTFALQLEQTEETWFSSPVILSPDANHIGFRYNVEDAGPGDELEISFDGAHVATLGLTSVIGSGFQSASLDISQYSGKAGAFRFEIKGPTTDPVILLIDDLTIAVESLPALGPIADVLTVNNGDPIRVVLPLFDADTAIGDLSVQVEWDNHDLVQEGSVSIERIDGQQVLVILPTPGMTGATTFDLAVRDRPTAPGGTDHAVRASFQVNIVGAPSPILVDGKLMVFGTEADDEIQVTLRSPSTPAQLAVAINGDTYTFDAASVASIELDGLGGDDQLQVTGTSATENVELRLGSLRLVNSSITLNAADFSEISVLSGGGQDRAYLYDSIGDDEFLASPASAELNGSGFSNRVVGYRRVYAYSYAGGRDVAHLDDSNGNDSFVGEAARSWITGNGYYNSASRFEQVDAYSSSGSDVAMMWDSPGNDFFQVNPTLGVLSGAGFDNRAYDFDRVYGYAYAGGNDEARLFDSTGDDRIVAKEVRSIIFSDNYYGSASRFEEVYGISTLGGKDRADLYGSFGDDSITLTADKSTMKGSTYFYEVSKFEIVNAYAGIGD